MGARERPESALDDDSVDHPPPEAVAVALAEAAEAEALAAEAEARAAAARARAIRLRRQAMAAGHSDGADMADLADPTGLDSAPPQRWWRRRPGRKDIAVGATVGLICVSLAASGYLLWHHRGITQQRQRTAEFAAVAREAVVTFMSLDANNTEENMQRIADLTTGRFKDGFPAISDELTKRLQQSQVVTTATVNEVAVESMTGDSAVVLVAATTGAKEPDGVERPQSWHIALRLTKDGGHPKISSIEFVP